MKGAVQGWPSAYCTSGKADEGGGAGSVIIGVDAGGQSLGTSTLRALRPGGRQLC